MNRSVVLFVNQAHSNRVGRPLNEEDCQLVGLLFKVFLLVDIYKF